MNLKDLARHLGLSQTTVSRALNGFPEVAEDTRRRVAEAARRFDYRPNAHARRLATGKANTIGLIFPVGQGILIDPHFAEFLAGVMETCTETETDIRIVGIRETDRSAYRRLSRLAAVDALIISSPAVEDPRMQVLTEAGIPFVLHGRTRSDTPYAYLDIDNDGAFRRATEFLVTLGHRRIGLINADTQLNFAHDRERGWAAALTERGLSAPPALESRGIMSEEDGYRAARHLLAGRDRPTALLVSSIIQAMGACRAIRDAGLAIGTDISVITHDDGLPAIRPEMMNPPLTTTHSPIRPAGRRIAEMARALAGGADVESCREVWPVDIVLRGSTLPATDI